MTDKTITMSLRINSHILGHTIQFLSDTYGDTIPIRNLSDLVRLPMLHLLNQVKPTWEHEPVPPMAAAILTKMTSQYRSPKGASKSIATMMRSLTPTEHWLDTVDYEFFALTVPSEHRPSFLRALEHLKSRTITVIHLLNSKPPIPMYFITFITYFNISHHLRLEELNLMNRIKESYQPQEGVE